MNYKDAMRELHKANVVDHPLSQDMKSIVASVVKMEKDMQAKGQRVEELEKQLQEVQDVPYVQPTQASVPLRRANDFATPYDAFVQMHLKLESGASVYRPLVGKMWKVFRVGSDAQGYTSLYAHMRKHYDIYTNGQNRMQGVRFKTYEERMRRYCGQGRAMPTSGQMRFVPEEHPMDTEEAVKSVIAEWMSQDLGTFNSAKQWLKIGRKDPIVRAMLGFRMQHIDNNSPDGRSKSVGRLLAPYVNGDVTFDIKGETYEMCSRADGHTTKYALRRVTE